MAASYPTPASGCRARNDSHTVCTMAIPAFSWFSAISELFVTAGVLYVVLRNKNRKRFSFPLFLIVALFEALVNVMYMANRAAEAAAGHPASHAISSGMKIFFAAHGLLSLLAYLIFVVLGVLAYQEQNAGRWFFRDRPGLTWTFLVLWTISIVSGEALFVMRYFF
ncbi:MAG: hypothetical protein ABIU54_12135 [Candidatus Eisenbacteria bacterium]